MEKTTKRLLSMILIVSMLLSISQMVLADTLSTYDEADESSAVNYDLPDGGAFEQLSAVTSTEVYSYEPSVLYDPAPMMTPVLFVFADQKYSGKEDAWKVLCESGLQEIAEQERAGVMLINPVGATWGAADEDVYAQLLDIICPGRNTATLSYTTYVNLLYVIGEGSGAAFVTEYLASQKNRATMIASALLIDATMPEQLAGDGGEPLPAYIVSGDTAIIDYYKNINGTNATDVDGDKTCYFAEEYTTKKVIVNSSDVTTLDKEIINDGWVSLLRRTMRHPIFTSVWASNGGHQNVSENDGQVLQDRPIVDELGLTFNEDCVDTSLPNQSGWYEWIPNEALETNNTETYPLLIIYHGSGDHPVYEAESNGWIELAGNQRLIVVSPEDNDDPDDNLDLIEYIIEKYPVDESRIYVSGFSLGGGNTLRTGEKYLDIFTAIAPLAPPARTQYFDYSESGYTSEEIDLPVFLSLSTNESGTTNSNPNGDGSRILIMHDTFNSVMELNEMDALIDTNALDYDTYEFYGYDISDNTIQFTTKHGSDMRLTSYANKAGIDMLRYNVTWGGAHNHYTEHAGIVWDFFKNFSRNPETKELIYTSDIELQLPKGAVFHGIGGTDDLGVEDSQAFIYVASDLYSPGPMMTPIIYVYPDAPLADEDAAWNYLKELGLQQLAEDEHAAVILVNPAGGTWGEVDVDVFEGLMKYVFYSSEFPGYNLTYANLQYVIGDGSGATFVNEYLTQNADRIAGVLTVGGSGNTASSGVALPAYIANGSYNTVNYYRSVNETDTTETENGKTVYSNSADSVRKVIVNSSNSSISAELINDAYYSLFRWTSRMSIETTVFYDYYTTETFVLLKRPDVEALDLVHYVVEGEDVGVSGQSRYYMWLPSEAIPGNPGYDPDEEFALIVDIHGGGDHPLFEAESNGWVELAGDERFIIVAPEDGAVGGQIGNDPSRNDHDLYPNLIAEILEKYPNIDQSRIYATGFSKGSKESHFIAMMHSDIFAAVAPMATASATMTFADEYEGSTLGEKDMPWFYLFGSNEADAVAWNDDGTRELKILRDGLIENIMVANGITPPETYDFEAYPWWGHDLEKGGMNYVTMHGFEVKSGYLRNDDGIPLIQLTYADGTDQTDTGPAHTHYTEYAKIAWDFLKQFARNTETKEIIYLGDKTEPEDSSTLSEDPSKPSEDPSAPSGDGSASDVSNPTSASSVGSAKTGDNMPYMILALIIVAATPAIVGWRKKISK